MKRKKNIEGSIPIQFEDTNLEVLARIVKAASRKYDCSVNINFNDGNRKVEFVGDETYKPYIAEEIQDMFK
jgi:hypothetical protein